MKKNRTVQTDIGPVTVNEYVPADEDFVLDVSRDIHTDFNFASESFWKGVSKRFFRNKRAVIGLVIIWLLYFFLTLLINTSVGAAALGDIAGNVVTRTVYDLDPFLRLLG